MTIESLTHLLRFLGLKKTKILLIAANPKDTSRLRLDKEEREITTGLRRSTKRKKFQIQSIQAARSKDIRRALLDHKPNIIHFSGHGSSDGIAFENDHGTSQYASTSALANLMKLFKQHTQCVVLNSCYSEIQAKAIAKHIPYVIGMNDAIGDNAAIEFSIGFYDAIGAGKSIEFAYNLGCTSIEMIDDSEHLTPVLKQKDDFSSPSINLAVNTTKEKNACIHIEAQRTERRELWNNNEQSIMRYIFAYPCSDANFEAAIRIAAERITEQTLAFKSDREYLNAVLEILKKHKHPATQDIYFLLGALNFRGG